MLVEYYLLFENYSIFYSRATIWFESKIHYSQSPSENITFYCLAIYMVANFNRILGAFIRRVFKRIGISCQFQIIWNIVNKRPHLVWIFFFSVLCRKYSSMLLLLLSFLNMIIIAFKICPFICCQNIQTSSSYSFVRRVVFS